MKQATLIPHLQTATAELAAREFPDWAGTDEIPLLIALPAGIHPYNRAGGYYDHLHNAIVLYQHFGHDALYGTLDLLVVAHELAHWYQVRCLKDTEPRATNPHRRKSWMESCFIGTSNLWPELELTLQDFMPTKSVRDESGKVRKVLRTGAMTDVQLHHWPYSLSEYTGKRVVL